MGLNDMLESIFNNKSPEQKEAVISFARYLTTYSLDDSNYTIFLKILNLNYEEASSIIFKGREPETFFSIISPSRELITAALNILTSYKPQKLSLENIRACLGIIYTVYKQPASGFSYYNLSISDIQHIGKYLILKNIKIENLVIPILESISSIPQKGNIDVSSFSRKVIDHFYDNKKKLEDIIPSVILK
jgi:hypothetical protein